MIQHRAHEVEPEPDVPLAEDLWEGYAQQILAENPGKSYDEARCDAYDRYAYRPPSLKDQGEDFAAVDVEESFRQTIAQMESQP